MSGEFLDTNIEIIRQEECSFIRSLYTIIKGSQYKINFMDLASGLVIVRHMMPDFLREMEEYDYSVNYILNFIQGQKDSETDKFLIPDLTKYLNGSVDSYNQLLSLFFIYFINNNEQGQLNVFEELVKYRKGKMSEDLMILDLERLFSGTNSFVNYVLDK